MSGSSAIQSDAATLWMLANQSLLPTPKTDLTDQQGRVEERNKYRQTDRVRER